MGYQCDPEGIEAAAIGSKMGDLRGKRVLEIGCGSGRLTPLFAETAASVTAIDPDADKITQAKANLPSYLHDRVRFRATEIEALTSPRPFDWVILSWSL